MILVSLDNFNNFYTKRQILTFLPRDEEYMEAVGKLEELFNEKK